MTGSSIWILLIGILRRRNKKANYALFNLMNDNPGYDVILYPQFETIVEKPVMGCGFLKKTTTVKVTARLGKLKN